MRVLITGASGFIGSALVAALHQAGHHLICGVHRRMVALPAGADTVTVDYMRDLESASWLPRLHGVDAVVNTVGILREKPGASFEALHHLAPQALFQACAQAGVRRVIQISALGADSGAVSAYHLSKRAADDALRSSGLDWTIVQPSVVFGPGGASTSLFLKLASLPIVPLAGRGDSRLQPIHIEDLTALVCRLLEDGCGTRETIPAVGPRAMTQREMLASYRSGLGLRPTLMAPVPMPIIRAAARVGDLRGGALSTETLAMLLRGSVAPGEVMTSVIGDPRPPEAFIPPAMAPALRLQAIWSWLRAPLVISVALVWILAGVSSWFFHYDYGLSLLQRLGLSGNLAILALAAACLVDFGLGMGALMSPGRAIWYAQLGLMAFYTAALTLAAPELWSDPFGPLVKNLPLGLVLIALAALER